jgi:hypothetical protein
VRNKSASQRAHVQTRPFFQAQALDKDVQGAAVRSQPVRQSGRNKCSHDAHELEVNDDVAFHYKTTELVKQQVYS